MSKKSARGRRSAPAAVGAEPVAPPAKSASPTPIAASPRWDELLMAAAIGIFLIFRIAWDGATYEYQNVYFLWAIAALFAVWGIRRLIRGGTIRFGRLTAVLGLFLGVAVLTAFGTVQVDSTLRALAVWTGHLLLFILVANALRSRVAIGIVLGAFTLGIFGELVYSYIHYYSILPYVRQQMINNPSLLISQFNTAELTPELAHRLNVNRASGSFLFANALAAFLILCIPYLLGEAANSLWRVRHEPADEPAGPALAGFTRWGLVTPEVLPRLVAAGAGLLFAFVVFSEVYYFYPRVQVMDHGSYSWTESPVATIFLAIVLPLAAGAVPVVCIARLGIRRGWYAVQAIVLSLLGVACLGTLWLSLSRGGVIALVLACAAATVIAWLGRGQSSERRRARMRAAAGVAMFALLSSALWQSHARAQDSTPPTPAPVVTPAPVPPGAPAQEAAPQPGRPEIKVEGVDVPLRDLANPTTFKYRLAYWTIALRIIGSHFWTGVGLGNFQALYPQFQALGEPPVRTAHNDYLQVFSETGVFGSLAFVAFWAFFLIWGLRRILRESNRGERRALLGLYTGLLAFLLHSGVDFNFYNPGLAALQFALAGVFLARAGTDAAVSKSSVHRAALIVLLIAAALAAGSSLRVHRAYALSGDDKAVATRLYLAESLLNPQSYKDGLPFRTSYTALSKLIPEREKIESIGTIYLPTDPRTRSYRPVEPSEELSADQLNSAVVIVRNPTAVKPRVLEAARRQIERLERSRALYPHNPETAVFLYQWHSFLLGQTDDPAAQRDALDAMIRWAKEATARDPNAATFRGLYGGALLRRGMVEPDLDKRLEYYRAAVEQYKKGTELYPISVPAWNEYATALEHYGVLLRESGHEDQANRYLRQAQKARAEAARVNVPPA